jgi:hypothetical protein
MEAICISEASVDFSGLTRRYVPKIELFITTVVRTSESADSETIEKNLPHPNWTQ